MAATITKKRPCVEMPQSRAAAARAPWLSALVWAGMPLWSAVAYAAGDAGSEHPWKLTMGEYLYAAYQGTDVNLRWRDAGADGWLGVYGDARFGTQARLGADTTIQVAKYLQVQPSLQLATRGFAGASVNLQIGGSWYGIAGLGRTDARPYFNLNFDPNDAVTLGAGYQGESGVSYAVLVIADNRFHTQQRDWHLNVHIPNGRSHVTLDLLRKSGLSDAGPVAAWGFSANYDWPWWFLRLAYDPYQNFSAQDAWRLAAGIRF